MPLSTLVLVVLSLLIFGALPVWPHSRAWGYSRSGLLGALLLAVVIFLLARGGA